MLRKNNFFNFYLEKYFERQEWVHEWICPAVSFFKLTSLEYLNDVPIAIMLEMQGGIDGYLLFNRCLVSYKTRAPMPIEENHRFWKQLAENSVWITPNLDMRLKLGVELDLPGKILKGVNLDNLAPLNLHEFSAQLTEAASKAN